MATALIHVPIHSPKRLPETVRGTGLAACAMALVLGGVIAMPESASAQTVRIQPRVDAGLIYSDNVRAGDDGRGDWRVELSPGISILRESGRFSGNLNARLRNVVHANETDRNDTFLALQGRGRIEAVERTLFLDMDASASRNNRSQLSGRRAGDLLDTDSSNETRTIGIGPRLEFMLGPETTGMVSYMNRWLSGQGSVDGRRQADWRANLANPVQFGRIGWGLAYTRSETDYGDSVSNAVSDETARATLYATVTPQFRLRAIAGYESNDYEVRSGEHSTILGGGFDWRPTERTAISATTEKRVFGRGYDFSLNHRGARSSWNLSYSRDIASSLQAQGLDVFGDPEFRTLYDALATGIPDPIEREAFVRAQLGYPAIGQRDSFLSNVHFLSRNLSGSVSLIGVRNVVTIVLQQSERSRLGGAVTSDPLDDFASFNTVTTRSATATFSHRLSQLSSLNASVLRSRAKGSGQTRADTERTVFSIGLSTQFGPDTSGGLTYTHQRSDGQSDFVENVLTANLGMRF